MNPLRPVEFISETEMVARGYAELEDLDLGVPVAYHSQNQQVCQLPLNPIVPPLVYDENPTELGFPEEEQCGPTFGYRHIYQGAQEPELNPPNCYDTGYGLGYHQPTTVNTNYIDPQYPFRRIYEYPSQTPSVVHHEPFEYYGDSHGPLPPLYHYRTLSGCPPPQEDVEPITLPNRFEENPYVPQFKEAPLRRVETQMEDEEGSIAQIIARSRQGLPKRGEGTKYECSMCRKQYCRRSTLKAHLRQHSGERPYQCTVCGKSFSQAANLTAHRRVHTGEKPFRCPICYRPFSQSSSLVTHKRTHTGERPYGCPHCAKAFTDSSTLTKHMRTHTGTKPYECNMCGLSFSQSGNLNRHMKTHLQTPEDDEEAMCDFRAE